MIMLSRLCKTTNMRCFSSTVIFRVRRIKEKPLQKLEEDEGVMDVDKWEDYRPRRKEQEETVRMTNFGTIRIDGDNQAEVNFHRKTLDPDGLGDKKLKSEKFEYGQGVIQPSLPKNDGVRYTDAMFEESIDPRFSKFSKFDKSKDNRDINIENQYFAFGQMRENRTLVPPVKYENELSSNSLKSDQQKSDLNFIDESIFGSAYHNFSSSLANKAHTVSVDPSVLLSREVTKEVDLNTIDQEYFGTQSTPLETPVLLENENIRESAKLQVESLSPERGVHPVTNDSLGYIDEQFFATHQVTDELSSNLSTPFKEHQSKTSLHNGTKSVTHTQTNEQDQDTIEDLNKLESDIKREKKIRKKRLQAKMKLKVVEKENKEMKILEEEEKGIDTISKVEPQAQTHSESLTSKSSELNSNSSPVTENLQNSNWFHMPIENSEVLTKKSETNDELQSKIKLKVVEKEILEEKEKGIDTISKVEPQADTHSEPLITKSSELTSNSSPLTENLQNSKWFQMPIENSEVLTNNSETNDELKAKMKLKRAQKALNDSKKIKEKLNQNNKKDLSDNLNENKFEAKPETSENVKPKGGPKKGKKKTKEVEPNVGALEYVRKLRNMEADAASVQTPHPHELLGHHLQDRLIAATSNLQPNTRGAAEVGSTEEELPEGKLVSCKRYSPPDVATYTTLEIQDLLFSKIIYNDNDIVALWKPYGFNMFPNTTSQGSYLMKEKELVLQGKIALQTHLPHLATKLDCKELHEVHRLDRTTTGVLLYAKTIEMRDKLKKLFAQRKIEKTYVAITNGVPSAREGVVNIPVGEGKIGSRYRMTLRPDYSASKVITNKKTSKAAHQEAVTDYRVVASHNSAGFIVCKMKTGRKHQIRLHLGLGLGCPILGDHKFWQVDAMDKPQKVKGDIINRLGIRASKSRDLPLFLHARSIVIPEVLPGGDLVITANLPHFFTKTMKRLRLKAARKET